MNITSPAGAGRRPELVVPAPLFATPPAAAAGDAGGVELVDFAPLFFWWVFFPKKNTFDLGAGLELRFIRRPKAGIGCCYPSCPNPLCSSTNFGSTNCSMFCA